MMNADVNREIEEELVSVLNGKLESLRIYLDPVQQIDSIVFSMSSGEMITLANDMLDLDDRREEGRLVVSKGADGVDNDVIEIPVKSHLNPKRFVFHIHPTFGNKGICGFTFQLFGKKHSIFVGAAPYTLVFLSDLFNDTKKPEFALSDYQELD
ncbi:hypothetical protein J6I90_01305 [Pseudidiomarina sp. 1APP75-32.1]|uniref:Uncharacterized protein n=2 Tax=Pseudidiomarina terrestris TaxID=2820060 RepID=A0AAW7QUE5_9GAMM|nr:hypothetical protein [Pseudidiomarina sp. 1APP75-32.1]MDN7123508.1 hypothetical protein [Pseudidiomarina sp. 1APP75-32.1]